MSKKAIGALLAAEAKAVEESEHASDPTPLCPTTSTHPRTPPRENLQVRFRDDEFDELTVYADQRGLPVSTLVRSLVLPRHRSG